MWAAAHKMLRMSSCEGQKWHQCESQFQCPFLGVSRQEDKRTSTVQEAVSDRPSLPWVLLLCTLNFSVGKRASLSSEIISSSNLHFPANGLVYSCWIVNGKSCINQVYGVFPTVDKKRGIPLGKRCVCGVSNRKYENMLSLLQESFCPMKTLASLAGTQKNHKQPEKASCSWGRCFWVLHI